VLVGAAVGLAAAQACSHGQDTAKQPDGCGTYCYDEQGSRPLVELMVLISYIGLYPETFRQQPRERLT